VKAAVVREPGADPVWADFDEPVVDEKHRLAYLVGAGIHPVVRSMVGGGHYGSAGVWPAVPGVDAVARTASGELIYTGWITAPWGTMAERMAVPAQFGIPVPDGADPLAVAAGLNPGMSSWLPLSTRHAERDGVGLGPVLILGATGMAGGLAVDNAAALGASRIVAVGRDAGRLERLSTRFSDGHVRTVRLTAGQQDDAAAIADALGDQAPDIVLDFVWGSVAEAAFAALQRRGIDDDDADIRYVEIGAIAGRTAAMPAALLRSRRITISGSGAGSASTQRIMEELPRFMARIADGTVEVPYTTYPLHRVVEAWRSDTGRRAVLVPDN
jgi:NADPH:quinone reductase-like Zn-dependent oxidoreductase